MKLQLQLVMIGLATFLVLASAEEAQSESLSNLSLSEVLIGTCEEDSSRKQLCDACMLDDCCSSQLTAQACLSCAQNEDDEECSLNEDDDYNGSYSIDQDSEDIDKRARKLIGKRARKLIGKRARKLIGKRARKLIGKRARKLIG